MKTKIDPTAGNVKQILEELYGELGVTPAEGKADGSCSSEQYGMTIILTLHKLGLIEAENLEACSMAWTTIPKNPSAMRQAAEKIGAQVAAPKVSAMLARYAPAKPAAK